MNNSVDKAIQDLILRSKLRRLDQELSIKFYELNRLLIKAKDKGADTDNPLPFEEKFLKLLSPDFVNEFSSYVDYLFESGMLSQMVDMTYSTTITEAEIAAAMEPMIYTLSKPFGAVWASEYREDIRGLVTEIYSLGKEAMGASIGFVPGTDNFIFDLVDTRAIAQLENMGVIWSSLGAEKQIITPAVISITRQGLEMGVGRVEFGRMLHQGLLGVIPERSSAYYQTLGSIVMNRARTLGRLNEAELLGFTRVTWLGIPDDAMCDRCEALDGQTWEVSNLTAIAERFIGANSPEELINNAPFANSIDTTTKELILANGNRVSYADGTDVLSEAGVGLPPLHGECYSKNTSVMTNEGWKKFPDVTGDELFLSLNPYTQHIEFVKAVGIIKKKVDTIDIVTDNKNVYMEVSKKHPWFGYRKIDDKVKPVFFPNKHCVEDGFMLLDFYNTFINFSEISIVTKDYNDFVHDVELEKNNTLLVMCEDKIIWGSNCRCTLIVESS